MNLILLSNKWIDQKVRRGLAKIEKKAFGKKFFCRCRNGRNGRMAPCPKKKNESQSTKDGDETLLCTSRHTLIVTHAHPPTRSHTHTHAHTHMHTSTYSLMPSYTLTHPNILLHSHKHLQMSIQIHCTTFTHTHSNTTNISSIFFSDVATISIGSLSVCTSNSK